MKLGAWLKAGNLIKVNSDLGLGKHFRKVAEEVLQWNVLRKFNTNAKIHLHKQCKFAFLREQVENVDRTFLPKKLQSLWLFISLTFLQRFHCNFTSVGYLFSGALYYQRQFPFNMMSRVISKVWKIPKYYRM